MTLWNGSFPFYPSVNTCFPFDTTWAIIISIFLSTLATFLIILPGIRGRGRLFWLLRVVLSLFVGAVVLTVQFTRDWETGWVTANTSYKSFSRALVNVDIGLHIGLVGLNITLVGECISQQEGIGCMFSSCAPGCQGSGTSSPQTSQSLSCPKAEKGSPPQPHTQGRAGSWAHSRCCIRTAFCTWLISILLFSMPILLYGGFMLLLTAVLMLFSLLFFFTAKNTPKCPIQFGPASLKTAYGGSFWLTLATGLLCLLLGLGIIILNSMQPEKLKLVFNLDKGKRKEEEGWYKSYLPTETSSSAQEVLMVPLGELCEVTATQL
ncbi:DOXA1 factor, partial [Oreotrochilus melanogaster]|nr:DOXA1 factor [Oreotrochilus melanogaster]